MKGSGVSGGGTSGNGPCTNTPSFSSCSSGCVSSNPAFLLTDFVSLQSADNLCREKNSASRYPQGLCVVGISCSPGKKSGEVQCRSVPDFARQAP